MYRQPFGDTVDMEVYEEAMYARIVVLEAASQTRNPTADDVRRWEGKLAPFDALSYFAVHFVCCPYDLHRWLLGRETTLFTARLRFASAKEIMERERLEWERDDTGRHVVPFDLALSILSRRACRIENGWAHVDDQQLPEVLATMFRTTTEDLVRLAYDAYDRMSYDHPQVAAATERVRRFLQQSVINIKPVGALESTIEAVADRQFPPCMQRWKGVLDTQHKLKDTGRLQYGLFLKGIGVSHNDALAYWKAHFTHVMSEDEFDKKYAGNITNVYKRDYTAMGCAKIIAHGCCPIRDIEDSQFNESCGVVCARHLHKKAPGRHQQHNKAIGSPVQYFRLLSSLEQEEKSESRPASPFETSDSSDSNS